jgi:hypothetical protein
MFAALQGVKLKKAEERAPLPEIESEQGQDLLSTLMSAMNQRRVDIKEDGEDEEDDDWDGKCWNR